MTTERYVLITGASKGIGRATALHLDQLGFHVFAGVRKLADGDALCREASDRLRPIVIDVTDQAAIASAVAQITQLVGAAGLYGLVNNAGIATAGALEFLPLDDLRWQIEVNVIGQLAVTQACLPLIRKAHGRIVNMSSVAGVMVTGQLAGAYHASKFALEALSDTLRWELKPWGIPVSAIEPGAIATPIWETSEAAANDLLAKLPPAAAEMYHEQTETLRKVARKAARNGAPPQLVAKSVAHALTARRPRRHYLVGRDAWIAAKVLVLLPATIRERFMVLV